MTDYNDMLMGAGGRAAKFETVGKSLVGTVLRIDTRQRTEIGSNRPLTWDDGNPKMHLVVQLQTEEHDDDEDDGIRNLYVNIPSQMQKAIADAVRKSGARGISEGGKLGVKFYKVDEPKQRGFNGQKLYSAKYEQPVYMTTEDSDELEPEAMPF